VEEKNIDKEDGSASETHDDLSDELEPAAAAAAVAAAQDRGDDDDEIVSTTGMNSREKRWREAKGKKETKETKKPKTAHKPQDDTKVEKKTAGFVIPDGFTIEMIKRANGNTKGRVDRYYISPTGQRLRSIKEVQRYLRYKNITDD